MNAFQKVFSLLLVLASTIFGSVILAFAGLSAPTGTNTYSIAPSVNPFPGNSKDTITPFGFGDAAIGGPILDLVVELPEYNSPVDIYLALTTNLYPGSIFVLDESNNFNLLSGTPIPVWKKSIQALVGDVIFHSIPTSSLPNNTTLVVYLLVVPSGDVTFSAFDLWTTRLEIQGQGTSGDDAGTSSSSSNSTTGVYEYDFETGTDGWNLGDAWSRTATSEGSGYELYGSGNGTAILTQAQGKITYVKFRFAREAGLNFNIITSQMRYTLEFASRSVCYFSLPIDGGNERCTYGHYPILPHTYHTVELYISDTSLDYFIDGEGVVGTDLSAPLDPQRSLSFEVMGDAQQGVTLDDVVVWVDKEASAPHEARSPYSWNPGQDVGPFENGISTGKIELTGNESLTLNNGKYSSYGDIYLKDHASLIINANTALYVSEIYLSDQSSLIIDGGYLLPIGRVMTPDTTPSGADVQSLLAAVYMDQNATSQIEDAKLEIHFIDVSGNSQLSMKNSRFFTEGGGMVTPYGAGQIYVENSSLGAITLPITSGATFKASNLKPGRFEYLDLRNDMDISGVNYNLVLKNTEIVPDTLPTGKQSDASERGWELEVNENSQVELTDCELRKLTFQIPGSGSPLTFRNLSVGQSVNATIGPVVLKNTSVRGQWGFYIHGNRQVTIEDSYGIWPLPYDTAQVTIRRSRMNEFDPRQYTGTITFEDSRWYGPGEIIMDCDFTMLGSLDLSVPTVAWRDSKVTREYVIQVKDASGSPAPGVTITLARGNDRVTATTDSQGQAKVMLKYDNSNHDKSWQLSTTNGITTTVGFFTKTPVVLQSNL